LTKVITLSCNLKLPLYFHLYSFIADVLQK
jgi:hypothetical protein